MSAQLVKELRRMTQAGIKDCSEALKENDNDLEKAAEFLRKKGLTKAVKKAGREANDGLVAFLSTDDGQTGVLVEVNCETDFVARNEGFQKLVDDLAKHIQERSPADVDALLAQDASFGEGSVNDAIQSKIATIGENIQLRRFARYDRQGNPGVVGGYIHTGSKLGVILELESSNEGAAKNEKIEELLQDLAMHITAAAPDFLKRDEVDAAAIEKEKEVLLEQLKDSNKPENVKEKIVEGRLNKFYQENCLVEQTFVKDQNMTIDQVLKAVGKDVGMELGIVRFSRFQIGA